MSLLDIVRYDLAFLFAYSMRERTHAHRRMEDNVPEDIKMERLRLMIEKFKSIQLDVQKEEIDAHHLVLIEGTSKRSEN